MPALVTAWEIVRRNDEADGVRSSGVDRFAADLTSNLERLSAALASGRFQPGALIGVQIPKPGGGVRRLQIPQVADRIVERAIADALTALTDPWFTPWSFAFRPALSVQEAHRLLAEERDDGATHVVRADLRDCFESLNRSRVITALTSRVDDAALAELVRRLCARPAWWRGALRDSQRGVAQGSPLSPLLCNLYLDALDRALLRRGVAAVRFADDLAAPAGDLREAQRALRIRDEEVKRLGLELHPGKTAVMSYAEGFTFLGEDFAGPYPGADAARQQPDRRTLYVGRQGSSIHLAKGRIVVSHDDEELLSAPQTHVGRIVIFGAVGLSCTLRSHALYQRIPVAFLSRRGTYLGRLDSADTDAIGLRRKQYRVSADDLVRRPIATAVVLGKIANQRALLMRYAARASNPENVVRAADDLDRYAQLVGQADDCGQLLGLEGTAARRYFEVFAELLPEHYTFPGRRRRPPTDVVNAMLSLGYACLTGEAAGAIAASGLDPGIGILHVDGDRPGLALDLVEEFRSLIVDTTVLNCARRGIVPPTATRPDPQGRGVFLTEAARVAFLEQLELRMLTLFGYTPGRGRVSYRRALHLQARQLAALIRHGNTTYEPVRWR
ncbi:MAG TPA: CRISPR-associated endonuclease Cas1 [Kineosporiaceae bacterium]